MTETRPMGGYRDIHPWPYHWSRRYARHLASHYTFVDALWGNLDHWTYENHVSLNAPWNDTPADHCVDTYWEFDGEYRLQLPPEVGDQVVEHLVRGLGEHIKLILWNYRQWDPVYGWRRYGGPQGDFVDHIHVEWRPEGETVEPG